MLNAKWTNCFFDTGWTLYPKKVKMLLPVFSAREGQMRNHRQFGGQSNDEKFSVAKQIFTC